MRLETHANLLVVGLVLLALAVTAIACRANPTGPEPTDMDPTVKVSPTNDPTPTIVPTSTAVVDDTTLDVYEPPSPPLEVVVPPCIPFPGSDVDPCLRRTSWEDSTPFIESDWRFPEVVRTFEEILQDWAEWPYSVPQFVVRATVIPESTRCARADFERSFRRAYEGGFSQVSGEGRAHCYWDIAVNEYLHGSGPARMTVDFQSHVYWPCDSHCLIETAQWIEDTIGYEGVEWVMYLGGPWDLGSGVWHAAWFDDVQRWDDGEIAVVDWWYGAALHGAGPPENLELNLSRLKHTLEDFRVVVREAYESFYALTGGRLGTVPDRFGRPAPFPATDASRAGFNDYIARTKMLEGLDLTPYVPPYYPSENDVNAQGLTVNDVIATRVAGGVKVPG